MNELKKYVGVIIILIAAFVLAIPALCGNAIASNTFLATIAIVMVIGLIVHVVVNRIFK